MTNSNKILAVVRPNRPKPHDIQQSEAKTDTKTDSQTRSQPDSQTESKPESSSNSKILSKPSTSDKPSPRPRPSSSDRPSRPSRPRPKQLQEVPQATNPAGETFNPGDQIWVRSPWGKWAIAEIDKFYQCSPDEIVAHFLPKEEREGWTWMGGCIRSQLLKKVPTPQA